MNVIVVIESHEHVCGYLHMCMHICVYLHVSQICVAQMKWGSQT